MVVWWARANSIYYRISSKHIWTWLNCPIHMNYFCDVFVNFLNHQNYGGMDFPWRDRNLLVFIKMSSFVFWWWTKVLWVWMTWGWVNDRIYFSEWQTLWVNSQVVIELMAKNLDWQTKPVGLHGEHSLLCRWLLQGYCLSEVALD